jgi:hypothetical protein
MEGYDRSVQEINIMSDKEFRSYLNKNRANVDKMFTDMTNSPEPAAEQMAELERSLNEQFEADIKGDASKMLDTLKETRIHLTKLQEGKKLTRAEQNERVAVMLARRLQLEHADSSVVPMTKEEAPVHPTIDKKQELKGKPITTPGPNPISDPAKTKGKDDKKKPPMPPPAPPIGGAEGEKKATGAKPTTPAPGSKQPPVPPALNTKSATSETPKPKE